eukprot:31336-Pelagococcus_subviridis.AAC.3
MDVLNQRKTTPLRPLLFAMPLLFSRSSGVAAEKTKSTVGYGPPRDEPFDSSFNRRFPVGIF